MSHRKTLLAASIIASLCQHAVVLNNGRLLSQGAPGVVLRDPAVREAYLGKGFAP